MRKRIVGVMGPGDDALVSDIKNAYALGKLIAEQGWILLTGGRNAGVMDAASKGAKSASGLTVGILPTADMSCLSDAVDIPIITGMGSARNSINVLTSDVVVACGTGAGTASEVGLAIKAKKKVILFNFNKKGVDFFLSLDDKRIFVASAPHDVIDIIKKITC